MARFSFLLVISALAACSSGVENGDQSVSPTNAGEASQRPQIMSAQSACKAQNHEDMEVGISDFEACLGEHANLTQPADRELCNLAKSTMSADGVCVLAE